MSFMGNPVIFGLPISTDNLVLSVEIVGNA